MPKEFQETIYPGGRLVIASDPALGITPETVPQVRLSIQQNGLGEWLFTRWTVDESYAIGAKIIHSATAAELRQPVPIEAMRTGHPALDNFVRGWHLLAGGKL